jgi:hypothetical protein
MHSRVVEDHDFGEIFVLRSAIADAHWLSDYSVMLVETASFLRWFTIST